jgi:hypothetical protein
MRTHNHAGRAVAALQSMFFPKSILQRMHLSVFRHSLNRNYVRPIRLDRKHRARFHRQAIGEHCARATDAGLASDVGSGKSGHVPDEVRQQ